MHILKNRAFAWCVFALAVVLTITLSGGGGLQSMRGDVEAIFYHGVNHDELSIDRDLHARTEAAYNLMTIAEKYGVDSATIHAVSESREETTKRDSISACYAANGKLTQAVESLYTALDAAELSDADKTFAYNQYKEFKARADTIGRDPYNQRAEAYNQSLNGVPAKWIAGLAGVKPLELFR